MNPTDTRDPSMTAAPTAAPGPVFEPFRWVNDADLRGNPREFRAARLTERVRDLAGGLSVVLGMLEREEIDEGFADDDGQPLPRLFSTPDRGNLLRMSVAVSEVLCILADTELACIQAERDRTHAGSEGAGS